MLSTYEQASQDELWKEQDRLRSVYDSLFKHTIECSIFIKGYVQKSWPGTAGQTHTLSSDPQLSCRTNAQFESRGKGGGVSGRI